MDQVIEAIKSLAQSQEWANYLLLALSAVGGLSVLASGVVSMTPTKKDDELLSKFEQGKISGLLWKFFRSFSVIKQK